MHLVLHYDNLITIDRTTGVFYVYGHLFRLFFVRVLDTRLGEVIQSLPTFDLHWLLILVEKLTALDSDVLVELWSVATEIRF